MQNPWLKSIKWNASLLRHVHLYSRIWTGRCAAFRSKCDSPKYRNTANIKLFVLVDKPSSGRYEIENGERESNNNQRKKNNNNTPTLSYSEPICILIQPKWQNVCIDTCLIVSIAIGTAWIIRFKFYWISYRYVTDKFSCALQFDIRCMRMKIFFSWWKFDFLPKQRTI